MENNFIKVHNYLLELDCEIISKNEQESLLIINKEEAGISNLVIDCEDPILIFEQQLFELKTENLSIFKALLQKNREIIHGAFALDQTGKNVIFRDTLQIENLDLNEIEGTLNSLEVLLGEYMNQIIEFSKN